MTPVETKKAQKGSGRTTWNLILAYTLVAVNIFLKGLLLYGIWLAVVSDDTAWRESIV